MAELTKEQLIEEAKLKIAITKCYPHSGMARIEGELFKIALASLEAEPVAWKATFTQIDHEYNTFTTMYSDKAEAERWVRLHEIGDFRAEITPLYAALTAPVVPDKLPREYIRGWPLAHSDYAEGWNDCREAMLQGKGKPGKQVCELTMLVRKLASRLKNAKPDCELPDRAIRYLERKGLISMEDILR